MTKEKTKGNQITEGIIWQQLLFFFFPILFGTFFQQLYNAADAMIVGRFVGKEALSAVGGSTSMLTQLIVGFFVGLSSGASVIVSQYYGAKRPEMVGYAVHTALMFSIISGVVIMFAGIGLAPFMLEAMGTPEDVLGLSVIYLRIYFIGIIANLVYNVGAAILRAVGDSKRPLYFLAASCLVNIALDIVLVVFCRLGVVGAALATIISQAVSCIWVIYFLTGKKTILKIRLKNLLPDKNIILTIVSLGISPFVMQATECLIQLTFNNGMLKYGNDNYVALMSILFSLMQLVWMPMQGFQQGAQPITSYNYGAKKLDRVKKTFKALFITCLGFSLAVVIAIELFPGLFLAIFTNNTELIEIGKTPLRIFIAGMSVMGAQGACQQTFLALGEAKISVFLACLRKIILLFPLALILPTVASLGVWGLFLAEPISDFLASGVTTTMFKIRSKKILQ